MQLTNTPKHSLTDSECMACEGGLLTFQQDTLELWTEPAGAKLTTVSLKGRMGQLSVVITSEFFTSTGQPLFPVRPRALRPPKSLPLAGCRVGGGRDGRWDEHVVGGGKHDGYLISMNGHINDYCAWLDTLIVGIDDPWHSQLPGFFIRF